MPSATSVSGWSLTNFGPLTTTYTAPSSCSTLLGDIEIAISTTDFDTNSTVIGLWGEPCGETIATVGSCLPSGAKMDSIMSTLDTNNPQAGYTVEYFSPGLVCPSGWETAGVATKVDGGSITSSGPGFVDPYPTSSFDVNFLENFSPNVLLAGMAEGETAILCCPTSFTASINGICMSVMPSYTVSSTFCQRVLNNNDAEAENVTLSIFGTTYTGSSISITGTGPIITETMTVPTSTESASGEYVGVSVVEMLYLVHAATDSAAASSSGSGSGSAAAANPKLRAFTLIVSTMVVAFTSGFLVLVL